MISVTIRRENNTITGYEISGHSTLAEHGKDIVCAAVSTLGQVTANGLIQVADIPVDITMKSGFLVCCLLDNNDKAQAILETMALGLVDIQRQYKDQLKLVEFGMGSEGFTVTYHNKNDKEEKE